MKVTSVLCALLGILVGCVLATVRSKLPILHVSPITFHDFLVPIVLWGILVPYSSHSPILHNYLSIRITYPLLLWFNCELTFTHSLNSLTVVVVTFLIGSNVASLFSFNSSPLPRVLVTSAIFALQSFILYRLLNEVLQSVLVCVETLDV